MTSEPRIVLKCADDGSKAVRLTPDDILTLKLLRDEWMRRSYVDTDLYQLSVRPSQIFETLERIFKQVG